MSIDLSTHTEQGVPAEALKESIAEVLRALTGLHLIPWVTLRESRRDRTDVPPDTQIGQRKSLYVLGLEGREDQVMVISTESERPTQKMVTAFSVGATRDDTEYVLGLAGAVGLAMITGSDVEDDSSFWMTEETAAPQVIIERLRLRSPAATFEEACKMVLSNAGQAE